MSASEYRRGRILGKAAGVSAHRRGQDFYDAGLDEVKAEAKRGDAFDRGYYVGFKEAVAPAVEPAGDA